MFGLTAAGLITDTQEAVKAELYTRFALVFGDDIEDSTSSNVGQLADINSEMMAAFEQVALDVFGSFDPANAEGVALDQRAALTGSVRKPATQSTVIVQATFASAGGTINDGDTIQNDDTGTYWDAYGGPYTSSGPWPETLDVTYRAQASGALGAPAGTNWSQVDVVTNLSSLANSADAELGDDTESDAAFRVRRQTELYKRGQGPLTTISGVVSAVSGVTAVRTYHNPDVNPTNSDGIPFKALNVVCEFAVSPPSASVQQAVFDAIMSVLGAGGQAYGTDYSGTATDPEGNSHPIAFDEVSDVLMEIRLTLTTSTSEVATTPNLADIIGPAVLALALTHEQSGRDVLAWEYAAVVGTLKAAGSLKGIDEILAEVKATTDGTWVAKRSISIREKADFDSLRITVLEV